MEFVDCTCLYFQILDADTTSGEFMRDTYHGDLELDEVACDAGWITSKLPLNADGDGGQGTLWIMTECNCFQGNYKKHMSLVFSDCLCSDKIPIDFMLCESKKDHSKRLEDYQKCCVC